MYLSETLFLLNIFLFFDSRRFYLKSSSKFAKIFIFYFRNVNCNLIFIYKGFYIGRMSYELK